MYVEYLSKFLHVPTLHPTPHATSNTVGMQSTLQCPPCTIRNTMQPIPLLPPDLTRERLKPADRGLPFYLLQYRNSTDIKLPTLNMSKLILYHYTECEQSQ